MLSHRSSTLTSTLRLSLRNNPRRHRLINPVFPLRPFTMSDKYQRNPHPDFKKVEAERPEWDASSSFRYTKTVDPDWQYGSGANHLQHSSSAASKAQDGQNGETQKHPHVSIDPYEEGRPSSFNYKLLISAVIPRPIAFISTHSSSSATSEESTTNLAPFSYFNMLNHDPPLFVVGFASSIASAKDTLRNVLSTRECTLNIISEGFLEAANATSVNAPYGVSEWDVSGLTPVYDCETVKSARVGEAVFSVEAKLDHVKEYESRREKGKITGTMCIFEGTRFWARGDALNEDKNLIDPAILRPVGRLGGITYSRTNEAVELTRPDFQKNVGGQEGMEKLKHNGS